MAEVRQGAVAIGGVGGSGTRVGAALLRLLDFEIGGDLNDALDNLWFTLLFKRRSVLVETDVAFSELVALFRSRMAGQVTLSDRHLTRLQRLAADGRLQHPRDWLLTRVESFSRPPVTGTAGRRFGWKEPNTHVIIDRLLELDPDLRYVHFVRHPLDMALSDNQHQLENWGPVFLNRDVRRDARDALAYWCAAHRRADDCRRSWPDRVLFVDFDALCADPDHACRAMAAFLQAEASDAVRAEFAALVGRGRPAGNRFGGVDLGQFNADDLRYVEELGYGLQPAAVDERLT